MSQRNEARQTGETRKKVKRQKKTGYNLNNPPKANLNVNTKNLNKNTKDNKVDTIASKIPNSLIKTFDVPNIY
jgi:hypothetical protein